MNTTFSSPEPAVAAPLTATAPPTVNHERFYMDTRSVKFKLDDGTLYNVFRYFFEQSPTFVEEYLSQDDVEVIYLKDVSRVDFDRFLSYMYPKSLGKCDVNTSEEWTSVLRLASKWGFTDLRAHSLEKLESTAAPIDRILIAREFDLPKWLLPAFVDLCTAPEPPTLEAAEHLGLPAVVNIGRIREKVIRAGGARNMGPFVLEQAVVDAKLAKGPAGPQIIQMPQFVFKQAVLARLLAAHVAAHCHLSPCAGDGQPDA
ncbi:uncharacterized protein SCHCODRAFT_02669226 [Schizophyllum commune H4-8]|nr:uncharacterized protein SCHCODRAFT_02669226 [Schizophyllum commune H4-8]KAI5890013.1 hypothetical protein SCHCODRAFT_02669226 [Schizophyllum commune H4-8]